MNIRGFKRTVKFCIILARYLSFGFKWFWDRKKSTKNVADLLDLLLNTINKRPLYPKKTNTEKYR